MLQGARIEPQKSTFKGLTTVPTYIEGLSRVRRDSKCSECAYNIMWGDGGLGGRGTGEDGGLGRTVDWGGRWTGGTAD